MHDVPRAVDPARFAALTRSDAGCNRCLVLAGAQQKPAKTAVKPGGISGRVFAITNAGDIKPARMADVYLFYVVRSANFSLPDVHKEYQGSAGGDQWMDQELKRLKTYGQWLEENGSTTSEVLICRRELLSYDEPVIGTMKWAEQQNKDWQVLTGNTDEEGMIDLTVSHPGMYRLVVHGRAGFNDAVWQSDVVVTPGAATKVKLSAPVKACIVEAEGAGPL